MRNQPRSVFLPITAGLRRDQGQVTVREVAAVEGGVVPVDEALKCGEEKYVGNVWVESHLENIVLDDLLPGCGESKVDMISRRDRNLFKIIAPVVVDLQDIAAAHPQGVLEVIADEQPEIVSQYGPENIKAMAILILKSEIPKLSRSLVDIYHEFNRRYFPSRLPEYHVRVVFDLHTVANEPVYGGSVSSGLIRFNERCIYLRYTKSPPMGGTLIHEVAHAATNGDHGEEWLAEMWRLKEAGAPVPAWDLE
jgi:hypothetical protein